MCTNRQTQSDVYHTNVLYKLTFYLLIYLIVTRTATFTPTTISKHGITYRKFVPLNDCFPHKPWLALACPDNPPLFVPNHCNQCRLAGQTKTFYTFFELSLASRHMTLFPTESVTKYTGMRLAKTNNNFATKTFQHLGPVVQSKSTKNYNDKLQCKSQ